MVFPVVMYGCENWTVKKAEHQRIDAFEQWCWRRLLIVPLTAWRSNQSILKEISPGCSLEGLMLKLKLQYFGHLMWRVDSLERELCCFYYEHVMDILTRKHVLYITVMLFCGHFTWTLKSAGALEYHKNTFPGLISNGMNKSGMFSNLSI